MYSKLKIPLFIFSHWICCIQRQQFRCDDTINRDQQHLSVPEFPCKRVSKFQVFKLTALDLSGLTQMSRGWTFHIKAAWRDGPLTLQNLAKEIKQIIKNSCKIQGMLFKNKEDKEREDDF